MTYSKYDIDNAIVFGLVLVILAVVLLAIAGAVPMDDTVIRNTLPPPAYNHPEEEP